jgi:hypothetical protein
VKLNLKSVGKNLQDHLSVLLMFGLNQSLALGEPKLEEVMEFARPGLPSGPLTSPIGIEVLVIPHETGSFQITL